MTSSLLSTLERHFGFSQFQPGQQEVIEHLMAGHSAAAVFATGAGKSLCFQLPSVLLPGLTLVVSPLIALMKDQVDALRARGLPADHLDSTLSFDEYRRIMAGMRSGETKLLYVAPERFNNERFRGALEGVKVSLFAVDEAHCISEWGHNFRPDYLKLARFAEEIGAERRLALTATATSAVLTDICRELSIASEHAVRTPFQRENLALRATATTDAERAELLVQRLTERPRGASIVYVTLQKTAEQVAERLRRGSIPARAYHAGMKPEERSAVQDWFAGEATPVVVATIAFGMGIDKADIRYVYHYNLAKSLENYAQEIGRAGRDGQPSVCETLLCLGDLLTLENFALGDTPAEGAIAGLCRDVFESGPELELNLSDLSREHDIRPLVLRTLLTRLELDGYLQGGTPFYAGYELKPLMPSKDMLEQLEPDERGLTRAVLARSKKARIWFSIDVDAAGVALDCGRERVVQVLDRLAERQMIELKSKSIRHRYRVLKSPDSQAELASQLYADCVQREERELGRLQQVVSMLTGSDCFADTLGRHFSEPLEAGCGTCSWCLEQQPVADARPPRPVPDDDQLRATLALRDDKPEALPNARALARFACGISSPAITRARLSKHALFGCQSEVPFRDVLGWFETA